MVGMRRFTLAALVGVLFACDEGGESTPWVYEWMACYDRCLADHRSDGNYEACQAPCDASVPSADAYCGVQASSRACESCSEWPFHRRCVVFPESDGCTEPDPVRPYPHLSFELDTRGICFDNMGL